MKQSRSALFPSLTPILLAPFLLIHAHGQGQYDLNGGAASLGTVSSYDGESAGDTHVPQAPYFESTGQRDAFLIRGGGVLTLSSGADISVANFANHTAFARVGYGTAGTLNIVDGAEFSVGQPNRYANFHVGHDASGLVNQTGGTASFIGSVNIGANGGSGTYTIGGGSFTLDQTDDGGTSLLSVGFNNAAATTEDSTGVFNIQGGTVNILSSHGGSTQFILGNRVNTALGSSNPSGLGNGTLNQSGGVLHIGTGAGFFLSGYGNGTYNLSGGSLEIGGNSLQARYGSGATGSYAFNFSGGSIVVTGASLISDVDINVTAGTASTFNTGGLNALLSGDLTGNGIFNKSGVGNLNLSGNNILTNQFYVTGGSVGQVGGDSEIRYLAVGSGTGMSGAYSVGGGSLEISNALQVGDFGGSGTFTVNGGDVFIGSVPGASLNVGNQGGTGVVNVESGSLTLGYSLHSLGRMDNRPAGTTAGSGTINISGGLVELVDGGSLILGDRIASNSNTTAKDAFGSGTLHQTGGTLRVTDGSLFLSGHGAMGTGTYNLYGGMLEVGGDSLRGRYNNSVSTYNFNLGGGMIKVIGEDLTSDVDINVADSDPSAAVSYSFIDTNSFDATLSGNLTGAGSLVKVGGGSLNLSGNNNLTSEFYVAGGAVNQTSGASAVRYFAIGSGAGVAADFNITGGSLSVDNALNVGDFGGTSVFTIDGGAVSVGNATGAALNLGNQGGTGTLNLESGSLTLGYGQHSTGRMDNRPAGTAAGSGTINVNGGLLEVVDGGSLILGDRIAVNANSTAKDAFGSGTLNQNGGIVRITDGSLFVAGHGATGSGTYNLNGGTLEVGGTSLRARYNNSVSSSTFNLGGGNLKVIGSKLETDVHFQLSAATTSRIDTSAHGASVSGFTGSGNLVKQGASDLAISSSSTIGDLTVEEGSVSTTASVTVRDLHLNLNTTFSGSGSIQVDGRLTGGGILAADTRINGTLAVGNSPGTMALSNDMTVGSGATFEFDLVGNAAGIAGVTQDQITLSLGTFTMENGSVFSIAFDGVDFASAFWGSDQSWLVIDGDGTGGVALGNVGISGNQDYSSYGAFGLVANGDNLTLSWTAVPEPGPAVLLAAALAPLVACRRRRLG